MFNENRLETAPKQHIRDLIESIKDGKLSVTFYDMIEPSYIETYDVSCTSADAEEFISKYEQLIESLEAIAKVREMIDSGTKPEDVLTPEHLEVWNTYVCRFNEKFDAGKYNIDELYARREDGDELSDEEHEILERHYEWLEEQSLKRLPKRVYSPKFLINRAQRYEYFVSHGAPKIVIEEEGRCLSEAMILYYAVK